MELLHRLVFQADGRHPPFLCPLLPALVPVCEQVQGVPGSLVSSHLLALLGLQTGGHEPYEKPLPPVAAAATSIGMGPGGLGFLRPGVPDSAELGKPRS